MDRCPRPIPTDEHGSIEAQDGEFAQTSDRNGDTHVATADNEVHCEKFPIHDVTSLMMEDVPSTEPRSSLPDKFSIQENLGPSGTKTNQKFSSERLWLPELVSLLLALRSFVAVLSILQQYESNLQPD